MASETTYELNDAPKLTVAFTSGGSPADPTTVTATVRKPDGTVTNYTVTAGQIVKDSVGNYHLTITADVAGRWSYKFSGTGTVVDTEQGVFYVIPDWTVSNPTFYVTPDELKSTISLGANFADVDISTSIMSASRAIDNLCERRFYPDADANQVRYYSPYAKALLEVDDICTITTLATDDDGSYAYANSWTLNTDFIAEPLNAAADSQPWTHLRALPQGSFLFNTFYPRSVKLTGKFGWATTPDTIVDATSYLSSRLLRLRREAPFGVVTFDGGAVRIARMDSTVMGLIGPYMKHRIAIA